MPACTVEAPPFRIYAPADAETTRLPPSGSIRPYDRSHTAISARISKPDREAVRALERLLGMRASDVLKAMPLPAAVLVGRALLEAQDEAEATR